MATGDSSHISPADLPIMAGDSSRHSAPASRGNHMVLTWAAREPLRLSLWAAVSHSSSFCPETSIRHRAVTAAERQTQASKGSSQSRIKV